jgi:Protein of unknown function (DUF3609).
MFEGCLSKIINEPIELKQDDCNTKLIKVTNTMWIQLKDNQHWIFAAPALETLRITCQTNVKEVVISETQLLWIRPGCTGTTNNVILHSQLDIEFNNSKSYSPVFKYDFSDEFAKIKNIIFNTTFKKLHVLESPDIKPADLRKLGDRLDDIANEAVKSDDTNET